MPKQFFIIPLANDAGLVELQTYLKGVLPEGTVFLDPATFHITLVVIEEMGEADLSSIDVPQNLPVFGLGGDMLTEFDTPDGWAVVLDISRTPQLTYLQAALFYELQARGVEVSGHSWPGLYRPHVTLAYSPTEPGWIGTPNALHFRVDHFALSAEGYEEVASWSLGAVSAETAIGEMQRVPVNDVLVVGEFRGSYPVVNTFADVDIEALTSGDDEPLFVTLPIGKDNAVSKNGRFYSREFVNALEKWVYELRPTGIQGHPDPAKLDTEFQTPSLFWVGTARVGEMLWGKAYVPPGETRETIRRTRATKGRLATSIYGYPGENGVTWDAQRGVYHIDPAGFKLLEIDLAPAGRAGVPDLEVVPQLTSEMTLTRRQENTERDDMGGQNDNPTNRLQVISELTDDDVRLLPENVRQAIIANSEPVKIIGEMASALGVEGTDTHAVLTAVKELVKEQEAVRRERLGAAIDKAVAEAVMPNAKQITDRVKAARATVAELVRVRQPSGPDDVAAVVAEIVEQPHVKTLVESLVVSEMGPSQGRHAARQGEGSGESYLKPLPEAQDK